MTQPIIADGGWEKWHDWHAGVMQPVIDWFCEMTDARPGERVLDAACGTGIPSLALAKHLGPEVHVVAADVSPAMVAAVGRKAAAAGLSNIEGRVLDVAALDAPSASFAAAACKDGIMYCADPVVGARELLRVVMPGARVAVSAWAEREANPFFTTMFGTVMRFAPAPPTAAGPATPGPFRLSGPGQLEATLREAGFRDVVLTRREVVFAFDSVDDHFTKVCDLAAPVQKIASSLAADDLARFRAALGEALAPFVGSDGRVRIPGVSLCASGRR